ARLEGERGRTTGQLRLFASHIRKGDYLDRRHDPALPDRQPLPRPDLKMIQRPVGPVAVFGASNFPLAFSTAGGDTASALAAGCPVIVKGHPAHPGTGELVARAISAAAARCGMPRAAFQFVQGAGQDVGEALVRHPEIRAVGFTGSLRGGRALFDLCHARDLPIPFYGELGSVNPVFLLPAALEARAGALAEGWVQSLTMGAGQFCTNPGVVVGISGDGLSTFTDAAIAAVAGMAGQKMLTEGIHRAYLAGVEALSQTAERIADPTGDAGPQYARPEIFWTNAATWAEAPALRHEVFGPAGVIVACKGRDEMLALAEGLEGQLTATIQADEADHALARDLLPVLEEKAGRLLFNGWPTGVEVCAAMMHGGPYPASTDVRSTSVGTLAITRWLRPVSYQNLPPALLPHPELAG
ncbi:MAG: aldehyde dehydrogenase (NADP(+)), partial [Rhodobacteraceae bacterium]